MSSQEDLLVPNSYQTRVSAGRNKPLASFAFPGVLEEVVLTMSHCLTAPSPKLSGYSVTSNILPPAPTTHGEWPGTGSTQPARRGLTKKSLTRCAERKGSTHIAQCHEAHSAPCRSRDLLVTPCIFVLHRSSWRMPDEKHQIQKGWGVVVCFFFFYLGLQLQTHAGKLTLEGWRKKKKKIHEMAPIAVTGPGSAPRSVRAEIDWDVWYPGNSRYLQLVIKPF